MGSSEFSQVTKNPTVEVVNAKKEKRLLWFVLNHVKI